MPLGLTRGKELIGPYKNGGSDYRPEGCPALPEPQRCIRWSSRFQPGVQLYLPAQEIGRRPVAKEPRSGVRWSCLSLRAFKKELSS
jgi:hypothetical protein